mmetsp:Transcript_7408/g.23247  ORF Transcript_7408/g.23247 Transcript_7408/m.23247 type:complete len:439 (-) Transcript_7408:7-1323(-)
MGEACCKLLRGQPQETVPEQGETSPMAPLTRGTQKGSEVELTVSPAHGAGGKLASKLRIPDKKGTRESSLASLVRSIRFTMQLDASRQTKLLEHADEVMGVAFSPDGRSLLAGGEDATLALWDVKGGSRRLEVKMKNAIQAVAYAPSGKYVAAGDAGACVSVWHAETMKEAGSTTLQGEVAAMALVSKPKELLAVTTTAKKAVLLSVPDMTEIAGLQHDGLLHCIAFAPAGDLLAGGCGAEGRHGLATKSPQDNEMKAIVWRLLPDGAGCERVVSVPFAGGVHAVAFSPSGRLLAVGREDRAVATLHVERAFEAVSELLCPAGVRCLSWSADSRFLATGGEDMQVSIWDLVTERIVLQLPLGNDWICGVAISPDGPWVASCSFESPGVTLHPVVVTKVAARKQNAAAPTAESKSLGGASPEGVSIIVPPCTDSKPVEN